MYAIVEAGDLFSIVIRRTGGAVWKGTKEQLISLATRKEAPLGMSVSSGLLVAYAAFLSGLKHE